MSFVQMAFHVTAISSVFSFTMLTLKMELLPTIDFITRNLAILWDMACLSTTVRSRFPECSLNVP
jgi:hypothetical protein